MKVGNVEVYGVIYKIINKVNGKIYIGQTINGFNQRYKSGGKGIERVYKSHSIRKKTRSYNEHLYHSIEKYGFESFEVLEVFDIAFSKSELDIKEKSWISIYKSNNRKFGYNISEGGNTHRIADETKRKISEIKKGKKHSEETKIKMRESQRKRCAEIKNKNKKNVKIKKSVKRKVICITTNKIFDSITEASKYYGIGISGIQDCCSGRQISSGKLKDGTKLQWSYYINGEYEKPRNPRYTPPPDNKRKVICLDTGEIFESLSQAALKYNIKMQCISDCCRGKQKTAAKHKWMYY